jgi:hypothetical protein
LHFAVRENAGTTVEEGGFQPPAKASRKPGFSRGLTLYLKMISHHAAKYSQRVQGKNQPSQNGASWRCTLKRLDYADCLL